MPVNVPDLQTMDAAHDLSAMDMTADRFHQNLVDLKGFICRLFPFLFANRSYGGGGIDVCRNPKVFHFWLLLVAPPSDFDCNDTSAHGRQIKIQAPCLGPENCCNWGGGDGACLCFVFA